MIKLLEELAGSIRRDINMEISQKILSDITVFNKYAKFMPDMKRRETWEELCYRNKSMHLKKYPYLRDDIEEAFKYIEAKKVLPSMRGLQFGGMPVELANNRIYNCAYAAVNDIAVFWETMFLLLGGTGMGYSVQKQHVDRLHVIQGPLKRPRKFLIADSIEGWADSVKVLIKAYYLGKSDPQFDFRDIRPKGARLVTSGGKAPGPDPLKICLARIRSILDNAVGRKLNTLECHDIMCYIADSVLSGGIRRAALIALFSADDMDMLSCKAGNWWELNPQRGRANNSVVLHRQYTNKEQFDNLWERVQLGQSGEPGIFWTNDYDLGGNPCNEISLNDCQFCNLSEINMSDVIDQEDFNQRSAISARIGTLQAGYTDFHYLRPKWQDVTEKEALIGVGQTGIASEKVLSLNLEQAAKIVLEENERIAKLIGINKAARTTTVKPSGTSSLTVGSSSGIHAWHNDYYIRRMRVGKNEPLYGYLIKKLPELVEDCKFKPHLEAVISFPQKAPEGAILRTESYLDLLERVKKYNTEWVKAGHREGLNRHNVSCTISIKPEDWKDCGSWMWKNRESYAGIAVLPYNGGSYVQAPFEDCTKEVYDDLMLYMSDIDLTEVIEEEDITDLKDQVACSGGLCEL